MQLKKNSNKKQYKVYIFCVLYILQCECEKNKIQIIAKINGCTVALACTTDLLSISVIKSYSLGFSLGHFLGYYKLGIFWHTCYVLKSIIWGSL